MVRTTQTLDIARLVNSGCRTPLAADVLAAYDAPFPDETYKAAPRAMPNLVPTTLDDPASAANIAAWERLSTMDIPFLVAFSDSDPITGGMAPILRRTMRGAAGISHPTIAGAGHFLQEDAGEELADAIVTFVRDHPR
jgi:haloalkane dehalogenase